MQLPLSKQLTETLQVILCLPVEFKESSKFKVD